MTDLSFDPLLNLADQIMAYTDAIDRGNQKFMAILPQVFKQTIDKLAAQRLDHTREHFKNSVTYEEKGDVFLVLIRENDWLSNSLEVGSGGWPMVTTHLKGWDSGHAKWKGGKTKISKEGYRYKVIPMRVWSTSASSGTKTGQNFFEMARATLKKPKIRPGSTKLKTNPNGSIMQTQIIDSNYSELEGLQRVSEWNNIEDYNSGKRPTSSKYLLFRTMSDKHPEKFVHPGIQARNILKDAETEVVGKLDSIWESLVQNEINGVQ